MQNKDRKFIELTKTLEKNISKVVHSNGEPLFVCHTTDKEFNTFNIKKSKDGFSFRQIKKG